MTVTAGQGSWTTLDAPAIGKSFPYYYFLALSNLQAEGSILNLLLFIFLEKLNFFIYLLLLYFIYLFLIEWFTSTRSPH